MSLFFNFIVVFFLAISLHVHHNSSFSTVVLAPVMQDRSYRFFTLSVYLNNDSTDLLLDISSPLSWVANCSTNSYYHLIPCSSSVCNALLRRPNFCSNCLPSTELGGCSRNTCFIFTENSKTIMDVAITDSFALHTTDGRNPGRLASIPGFVFSCSRKNFGPKGTAGVASLGRSNFSLSAQATRTGHVFALCLSGSPSAPGVAFFGSRGPYYFLPQVDLSNYLDYTPLLSTPIGRSSQYFIGFSGLRVNDKPVQLNQTLVNRVDLSRVRLDTMTPYTMIHTNIYHAFIEAFLKESAMLNLTVTEPVKPFDVCYKAEDIAETNLGPNVPPVDLEMRREDVRWRFTGSNSMVRIYRDGLDLWCLGFINGGMKMRPLIVIGGHQMVDNLLQFDLENNRLGFTASSVVEHNTMCANFNFTNNNT